MFVLAIFSTLIAIVVYDVRHKIIPNGLVYLFILISFIHLFIDTGKYAFISPDRLDLLSGLIIASPLLLLWMVSKGRWIGFGDVKIALGVGWFLGIMGGISVLLLSFWIGAFASVLLFLISFLLKKFASVSWITQLNLVSKNFTMKNNTI